MDIRRGGSFGATMILQRPVLASRAVGEVCGLILVGNLEATQCTESQIGNPGLNRW